MDTPAKAYTTHNATLLPGITVVLSETKRCPVTLSSCGNCGDINQRLKTYGGS